MTEDTILPFWFPAISRKKITAAFDGGRLTSDGGVMLLSLADRRAGVTEKLSCVFPERRDPTRIVHSVCDVIRARIFAIACGYEDGNDLDHLRGDPAFKLACGRLPDTDLDLCSQPTVSRLENAPRLREAIRLSYALVDMWMDSYSRPPRAVTLDIDDTVDVVHGRQQLCLFNAHYDEHCFLPIHVYDTERSRPVAVDRALLAQAQRAGATTFEQTSLADAARTKSGWNLSMRSARGVRALFCNFIVDATGRTSVFARRQGVTWQRFGDLIAAAGRLRTADPCIPDDLTLRVSACEHGWWSMAPTPDGAIVATFYGSAETKRAMRISEREWWQWGLACSPNMRAILKDSAAEPDEVCIYPAFPRLLRRMQGRHWFAIGDAAASHDPLSGHGILYAFESAFRAAEMVSANIPVEQIGPIYQEAITARFAHHIAGRRAAYAEAEHLFPASRFWMAMTEEPTSGGEA